MTRRERERRPPRILGRVLARALPKDVREGILGGMEETWRARRTRHGPLRAGAWYAGQALALVVRFLPERLADASARSLGVSWLDLKLGFRMLGKHPGLSLAGGAALAVTIAFGAGLYEFFGEFISIELPFPDGDRIVRITNWDVEEASGEPRSIADFVTWREEVRSIQPLAALASFEANVAGTGGVPVPLSGVRTTAALFEVVRVPPALGRPLLPSDEVEGAAPVVVVSDYVWRNQLGAAPLDALFLRIGGVEHEVVGVMPEGFRFPVDHRFWVPLRVASTGQVPREGVPLRVFGRLAPGATMESAQAELTTLGRRAAERWPDTHARLEPRVTAFFGSPGGDWQRRVALAVQTGFGFLLALAALNVAILSFSRTASRQGEIAVRTALGAGRRRIVTQLFAEALVLSGAAAVVGLMVARWVVPRASELFWSAQNADVPYWVEPGLSAETIGYALVLGVLGASIAGVVPALKVTGKEVGEGLRSVTLGGSPLRFGALPTTVIVVQVALAVAFLPYPASRALSMAHYRTATDALAGEQILSARLQPAVEGAAASGEEDEEEQEIRFAQRLEELRAGLASEPEVVAVTFGDRVPGQKHQSVEVRLDGSGDPAAGDVDAHTAAVAPGYFEALDARIVAGRPFGPADLDAGAGITVAIANEAFGQQMPGGGNVLGRRIRFGQDGAGEGSWLTVVGIVEDLDVAPVSSVDEGVRAPGGVPAVYVPSTLVDLERVLVAVRLAGPAAAFGPELRRLAAAVDPEMRVDDVLSLDAVAADTNAPQDIFLALAVLLAALITGLAVGGVYTLMSFLVQQRTREIGIRTALGAEPATLLRDIFSRSMGQLTLGLVLGFGILALFLRDEDGSIVWVSLASAALVLLAGTAACVLPSRRALRIEPTEALRSD